MRIAWNVKNVQNKQGTLCSIEYLGKLLLITLSLYIRDHYFFFTGIKYIPVRDTNL